jgi:hypothetical protein
MAITELAILKILPPFSLTSPQIQSFFRSVSKYQSAHSGYRLFYYRDLPESIQSHTMLVYLISGWTSVAAHMEWIATDTNQELLRIAKEEAFLEVQSLLYLEIDFSKMEEATDGSEIVGFWKSRSGNTDELLAGEVENLYTGTKDKAAWLGLGKDAEGKTNNTYALAIFKDGTELGPEENEGWTILKPLQISRE